MLTHRLPAPTAQASAMTTSAHATQKRAAQALQGDSSTAHSLGACDPSEHSVPLCPGDSHAGQAFFLSHSGSFLLSFIDFISQDNYGEKQSQHFREATLPLFVLKFFRMRKKLSLPPQTPAPTRAGPGCNQHPETPPGVPHGCQSHGHQLLPPRVADFPTGWRCPKQQPTPFTAPLLLFLKCE